MGGDLAFRSHRARESQDHHVARARPKLVGALAEDLGVGTRRGQGRREIHESGRDGDDVLAGVQGVFDPTYGAADDHGPAPGTIRAVG